MTKIPLPTRAAVLLAAILGMASCDREPKQTTAAEATPPAMQTTTPAAPDKQGITFGDGFYKEEATSTAVLRWVRQDASLRVEVPTEGRYRLTFRPFTVYSNDENVIEISIGGHPAGQVSARVFNLVDPPPAPVEVSLRAGTNDLRLHSSRPERRLSPEDDRTAAFGLVLPIAVERLP